MSKRQNVPPAMIAHELIHGMRELSGETPQYMESNPKVRRLMDQLVDQARELCIEKGKLELKLQDFTARAAERDERQYHPHEAQIREVIGPETVGRNRHAFGDMTYDGGGTHHI